MIDYDRLHFLAVRMHLWIFKTAVDEKEAYDEIGLTDEENAELGYGGQIVLGKTTNYDRVRDLSVEEMAKKLSGLQSFALGCGCGLSTDEWIEWLNREVQDG